MAGLVKMIRIENMEECSDVSAKPHASTPGCMTLKQGEDLIYLDREGAALLAEYLLEWARGDDDDHNQ